MRTIVCMHFNETSKTMYIFHLSLLIKRSKLLWYVLYIFPFIFVDYKDENYYLYTCGSINPIHLRRLSFCFKEKPLSLFLLWYVFVLSEWMLWWRIKCRSKCVTHYSSCRRKCPRSRGWMRIGLISFKRKRQPKKIKWCIFSINCH